MKNDPSHTTTGSYEANPGPGAAWNNLSSRRRFLKQAGGAAVGVSVLTNSTIGVSLAQASGSITDDSWWIRPNGGIGPVPNPEDQSGTPFPVTVGSTTVNRRYVRRVQVTYDHPGLAGAVGVWRGPAMGTSTATAHNRITINVTYHLQQQSGTTYNDIQALPAYSLSYSRVVAATIDGSGNVTFNYNDGTSVDSAENGSTITLVPNSTGAGAVALSGPVGSTPAFNIPNGTTEALAAFEKKHGMYGTPVATP
jgi:hypothetical protein